MAKIIGALRSAVVPRAGAFSHLSVHELAAPVIQSVIDQAGVETDQVDELVVSNALGAGGNPARLCALAAGLPVDVAGLSIDRQCVGGLDAIIRAADMVDAGRARLVVAGGVESYSRRPLRMHSNHGADIGVAYDRPAFAPEPAFDPDPHEAMALLAAKHSISREKQEAYAQKSHQSALDAGDHLAHEIVEIAGITRDPYARKLSEQVLAKAPVLAGTVTAATAAVAADGAAFVVVVADDFETNVLHSLSVGPAQTIGAAPKDPALAPIPAIKGVLSKHGKNIDRVEMMEAYAVQSMACIDGAGLHMNSVNMCGGALARGHPIGASGAILAVRLFHDLQPAQSGLAAIAAVGGLGSAVILERSA
jgi:acetyl-CoA C-acetyltransferase